MRKLLAILLSAVMLMPEVYAEPLVNNNISSENEGSEIIDGGTITEDPIDEVVTDTKEDETPVTEDTDNDVPVVTTPAEETSDETVTEEQNTPVLLADEGVQSRTVPTNPSLTLEEAKEYTVTNDSGPVHVLSVAGDGKITVTGGPGLILLSNVNPGEYKDKNIELASTSTGWNVTNEQEFFYVVNESSENKTLSFLGLGNEDNPYAGKINYDNAAKVFPITTNYPLFNAINSNAKLPNLTFMIDKVASTLPLFANTVVGNGTLDCNITLQLTSASDGPTEDTIGGLIGTIKSETIVNLSFTNLITGTLTVTGDGDRGLFCNAMERNSKLTANLVSEGSITVEVNTGSNGNAGGFVGLMVENNNLSVSGKSVDNVNTPDGNAGGLVGKATDANISVIGESSFSIIGLNISAGRDKAAGGLFGDYTNTKNTIMDLSKYDFGVTISSGKNTGGVFGVLTNNGNGNGIIDIHSADSDFSQTEPEMFRVKSVLADNASDVSTFGGILGTYSSDNLSNTLTIQNVSIKSQSKDKPSFYGGVIGTLPTTSYVEINNLAVDTRNTASKFGGLVASAGETSAIMLNVGNVKMSCSYHDIHQNNRGGLIGYFDKGVLRLHGTTDLSKQRMNTASAGTGQIVGNNNNGLVYAIGTGNDSDSGWLLIRSGTAMTSDIGNWGQVIRLDGVKLKEQADEAEVAKDLLSFDATTHTVTLLGEVSKNYSINYVRDFAAYAIVYDLEGNQNEVLRFEGNNYGEVKPNKVEQNLIIAADIDLTGTGIMGIGKDNAYGNADAKEFKGKISSDSEIKRKITIDIGQDSFGNDCTNYNDLFSRGGLWSYKNNHSFLALFPVAGDVTVRNLNIAGSITAKCNDSSNKRYAGIIGYCRPTTQIVFENVESSVSVTTSGSKSNIYQGGFIGDVVNGTQKIKFNGCVWSGKSVSSVTYDVSNQSFIGGFIGYVKEGKKELSIIDSIVSGTVTADNNTWQDVHMGGLIAEFQDGNNTEMTINNLQISNANIDAKTATKTCGGLLGYCWPKVNVTFGNGISSGVTIAGSKLNANNAVFGGLVYQASGYWNATSANSIKFASGENGKFNEFTGKSEQTNTSGLLIGTGLVKNSSDNVISALYLEVGTWGSEDSAYYIAPDSIRLFLNGDREYFDELVGITINDNAGNDNAVISLATNNHTLINQSSNQSSCNTYKGQFSNYKNGKSRYYYNLDYYRSSGNENKSTLSLDSLSSTSSVLSWSVSQYAASNIRDYFFSDASTSITISGTIDFNGYSYYPITPLVSVTVGIEQAETLTSLSFNYDSMNSFEKVTNSENKQFDIKERQHYLMQFGLFNNISQNLKVQNTTFDGNVGKTEDDSGALIYGNIIGNNDHQLTIELHNITLNGLSISGYSDGYAPLLINKNENGGMSLTINGLCTGTDYADNSVVASSLIGNIGSTTAQKIALYFSNIALDGRTTAGDKIIKNNGNENYQIKYNTTRSIFKNAILLNSFQYLSNSTGIYNFNSTDIKVSFGKEISNTTSGRNPGEQYQYYDNNDYAWDGVSEKPQPDTISEYYLQYLPYIMNGENSTYHELDVNLPPTNLAVGCGTYGHPYEITSGKQFITLAKFLSTGTANNWVVYIDTDVFTNQKQTEVHTMDNADSSKHKYYLCDGSSWFVAEKNGDLFTKGEVADEITTTQMKAYLRNAYYQITDDIIIASNEFIGVGAENIDEAFSGVIVGKKKADNSYPTVFISSTIGNATNFGGLICYSQGSVVKDLKVSYAGGTIGTGQNQKDVSAASITMSNSTVPGTVTNNIINNPFFGGVVGYCMGGDTIVDNVEVIYGDNSITLDKSTNYVHLIAVGGYVGLVGGAKNSSGIEVTGGGLIFRNMAERENPFIGGSLNDNSLEGSTYFYCNPFVGRVLDGYVLYDGGNDGNSTLNNTNKNYTIPDITSGKDDLNVTKNSDDSFSVEITSAKGLWLLSSIVNSGAGAMDESSHVYRHQYGDTNGATIEINAYKLGKPRTASYDNIGNTADNSDLVDERFWGGVSFTSPDRVSFLVKNYTSTDENGTLHASRIAGGNSLPNISLSFSKDMIDLTSYGNGFRGIGSSYAKGIKTWGTTNAMQGRFLRIKEIRSNVPGKTESHTTIKLGIDQKDYSENYYNNGWFTQGTGLFVGFVFSDGCRVNNLTLSGKSMLILHDNEDSEIYFIKSAGQSLNYENNGEVPVGGFANRTANSSGSLIFNNLRLEDLSVYGGHHAAGVIGMVEGTGGQKNITFNNWYIGKNSNGQKTKIGKKTYNDGSSAGLLGWCYSSPTTSVNSPIITLNGFGLDSEKWNVDGVCVSANTYYNSSATSCGLIGACDGYQVKILGVRANDIEVNGSNMRECGGLADGGGFVTIENCWIEDLRTIDDNGSGSVGGLLGKATNPTIKNCYLVGSENKPIKVLATSNHAGGLVGTMKGGNISNVMLSNVFVATKNNNKNAGLLSSYLSSGNCNGYNILADNCKVGYNKNATIDNIGTLESNNNIGLWFGKNDGTIKLVAVAIKGTNSPLKDVGNGTANIVYADYPAVQTNMSGTTSPYIDVNPKSDLKVKDVVETDKGNTTTLTGNGVGYVTEDEKSLTNSVAYSILNESKAGGENRKYFNLPTGATTAIAKYLPDAQGKYSNDVYLTTYQNEETGNTTVKTDIDFPILVVSGLADANQAIWNYIAALTNVQSGDKAIEQATEVTATTYKWNGSEFEHRADSNIKNSLTVNSSDNKTISVSKNAYDNQQSQFTLLNVKFADPTGVNDNGFHLYVPVLVKKLLYTTFSVKMLTGTDYLNQSYTESNTSYATADFNEQITAYVEYNYDRTKADWEKMLTNGENLLWNYNKVLDLAVNASNTSLLNTHLTLVDRKTKQVFYHSISSTDNINEFELSCMTTADSEYFAPVPICDLLELKIDPELTDGKTQYVITESAQATVRVKGTYYRPATNEEKSDTRIPKSNISVGCNFNTNGSTSYLENGEGYYLTIQIPKTTNVINHPLSYSSGTMTAENAPVASIISNREQVAKNYIVYDGILQSDIVTKSSILGRADNIISDSDIIKVSLTTQLSLTPEGKDYFRNNGPIELDHQFNIIMKKYDEDNQVTDVLIGAEGASYSYTITSSEATDLWDPVEVTEVQSATMEKLTINCGKNNAQKIAEYFKEHKEGILTIQAVITLPYPTVGSFFPGRNTVDDPSGISVAADSRVATATTQLPITQNKKTIEDEERYYTQNPSEATLIYNTYDGDGTGDDTRKLGVNPSDTTNDLSRTFYTSAVYNYANVDPSILSNAHSIKYSMQLFQKQNDGSYGNALENIDEYLPSVTEMSHADGQEIKTLIKTKEFTQDVTKSDTLNIQITPLTGGEFEAKEFTYSNYKVVLTAVLLDIDGNELAGTKASDYIVYTNARIYQRIIDATN